MKLSKKKEQNAETHYRNYRGREIEKIFGFWVTFEQNSNWPKKFQISRQ